MSLSLSQTRRPAILTSPFGDSVLHFTSMAAREGISETFLFEVEAVSTQSALDFDRALGKNCCVSYTTHKGELRHYNGVLTAAEWLGQRSDLHHYRLTLEPWFRLLDYVSDCRFFQQMTVIDIVRQVFSESGFSDFEFRTSESYDKIEYCVQYREAHGAFVSRLLEEQGIYYFFEHGKDRHTMVLADSRSSLRPAPGLASVPFRHLGETNFRDEQYISAWRPTRRFQSGKVALNDYDYLKPSARLLAQSSKPGGYAKSDLEVYDYHARYDERGKGERLARIRLEARQSLDFRREGAGDAASLVPGTLTKLAEHAQASENIQYLVVGCSHRLTAQGYLSGQDGQNDGYAGTYLLQPADRPFRAPFRTPKPSISGVQTARVVGKEGEEIDVDEHGRILVQFHWDRDKKQSRRVRVAQNWSGNAWGSIVTPRIGMEVVVEFVEGDPDFPLVTGTVYNGQNRTPFALPKDKTVSGMKSRSSKSDNGYNQLSFEDKTDQEKIHLHGEKDLDIKVKHAETREIGCEFSPPRGKASRSTKLKAGDDVLKVDTGDQKISIGGSQKVDVVETIRITAGVQLQLQVGASVITMTPASISIVSPSISISAAGPLSASGATVSVAGAGALSLTGAVVKIN